ncbi:MAG: hypothetical protein WBW33_20910, partial [Bryobacteraceae bacterium]
MAEPIRQNSPINLISTDEGNPRYYTLMRDSLRLILLLIPLLCPAQNVKRSELAPVLNFETEQIGGVPHGWGGGPPKTIFTDDKIVHSGKWAAR